MSGREKLSEKRRKAKCMKGSFHSIIREKMMLLSTLSEKRSYSTGGRVYGSQTQQNNIYEISNTKKEPGGNDG